MIIPDYLVEHFIKNYKAKNKKVVLVGGCFDILHSAHIEFLKKAKLEGDVLILLLESDENIKKIKGKQRPINNFDSRAYTLEKLNVVDLIVELSPQVSDKYYFNLTKLIRPDIIALTKNDPLFEKKKTQADEVGGRVVEIMKRDENYSTTQLINKI